MKSYRRQLLTLIGGLVLAPSLLAAEARPVLRWQLLDFPPYFIFSGPQRGEGLADHLLASIEKLLPEFEHQHELTAPIRQTAQMKTGQLAYTVTMLRTPEREQFMDFTQRPFNWQMPQVLMIKAQHPLLKTLHRDAEGRISLAEWLGQPDAHLGVSARRSYGRDLDQLLTQFRTEHPESIREVRQDSLLAEALRLLKWGRFEATLGYPTEAEFLRQHEPALVSDLLFLPLKENAALLPQYVGCSRHPDGKRAISLLDGRDAEMAAIRQRVRDEYTERLPAALRAHYLKLRAEKD